MSAAASSNRELMKGLTDDVKLHLLSGNQIQAYGYSLYIVPDGFEIRCYSADDEHPIGPSDDLDAALLAHFTKAIDPLLSGLVKIGEMGIIEMVTKEIMIIKIDVMVSLNEDGSWRFTVSGDMHPHSRNYPKHTAMLHQTVREMTEILKAWHK